MGTVQALAAQASAAARNAGHERAGLARATVHAVTDAGLVIVRREEDGGHLQECEVLLGSGALEAGTPVLVADLGAGETHPVILGAIGPYAPPSPEAHVRVQAGESLTLECGESSIAMRADGKVVIRGDDVLVRAKGTQRIRAGTVSIN